MPLERVALQKTSLVDFPGEVAATVFTPGCNLRCPYCHNPSLVLPPFPGDMVGRTELEEFLERRQEVLGGVCISGGEPLLHPDLPELIALIRSRGLKVKLDTNGTFPDRLARAEVDYVALDLKTDPGSYDSLLPCDVNSACSPGRAGAAGEALRESVEVLRRGSVPYELRTTVVPGYFGTAELRSLLPLLRGAERYVLQPYRPGKTLEPAWSEVPAPSPGLMEELREIAVQAGLPVRVAAPAAG
jgi:pyruvate formate lyase activating enzyme